MTVATSFFILNEQGYQLGLSWRLPSPRNMNGET